MFKKYIIPIITLLLISNSAFAQTVTVYLTTSGGSLGSEKWVNITTGVNGTGTQVWGQGNGTLGNGSGFLSDEAITLNCGTTYYLNAYDRWGDDWDGSTYELRDAISGGGTLIINNGGNSPDGFGGFNSSSWVAGVDLETSESFTVACPCANPPVATYTVVEDCPNSQFSINVNVTALGDASDVNITNDGGVAATNNAGTGTTSIGPFTAGTNVTITVNGTPYGGCSIASSALSASCVVSSSQDCAGGTSICNDALLSGNSNGPGPIDDIDGTTGGCLGINENESSWYFFEAQTSGKLEFAIKPINGTDDYDFALWGPYPSGSTPASICPPSGAPIRCSFAAGAPNPLTGTGLVTGAGDTSEDTGGDDIVDPIFPTAGDVYILLIDNYAATTSPFNMDMTLTNGLTLNCTALPIELLSFNGYSEDGYNRLEWQTTSELNNDRFVVQKSHDGVLFQYLGEIEGKANSNRNVEYNFIDENINNGILYYRLRQEDFDGSYSYSNTIAVKQSANAEVAFFPNPTKGNVKLNFVSKSDEEVTITINSAFQQIHQQKINFPRGNHVYDIEVFRELAPGFYIVNAIDSNGNTIKTEKIIKN